MTKRKKKMTRRRRRRKDFSEKGEGGMKRRPGSDKRQKRRNIPSNGTKVFFSSSLSFSYGTHIHLPSIKNDGLVSRRREVSHWTRGARAKAGWWPRGGVESVQWKKKKKKMSNMEEEIDSKTGMTWSGSQWLFQVHRQRSVGKSAELDDDGTTSSLPCHSRNLVPFWTARAELCFAETTSSSLRINKTLNVPLTR